MGGEESTADGMLMAALLTAGAVLLGFLGLIVCRRRGDLPVDQLIV